MGLLQANDIAGLFCNFMFNCSVALVGKNFFSWMAIRHLIMQEQYRICWLTCILSSPELHWTHQRTMSVETCQFQTVMQLWQRSGILSSKWSRKFLKKIWPSSLSEHIWSLVYFIFFFGRSLKYESVSLIPQMCLKPLSKRQADLAVDVFWRLAAVMEIFSCSLSPSILNTWNTVFTRI